MKRRSGEILFVYVFKPSSTLALVEASTRVNTGGSSRNFHDPLLPRSATFGSSVRLSVFNALAMVLMKTALDFGSTFPKGLSLLAYACRYHTSSTPMLCRRFILSR